MYRNITLDNLWITSFMRAHVQNMFSVFSYINCADFGKVPLLKGQYTNLLLLWLF